jgi:thiamine-monophosphate kinase
LVLGSTNKGLIFKAGAVITQAEAVQILTSIFRSERPDVEVGAGLDDVAVIRFAEGRLAVSVDFTNFRPLGSELGISSFPDKGYLLIVHNVSDLIASGAKPVAAVVALGLPSTVQRHDIEALGKGIRLAADECDMVVVGGDTKEAPCLALNATVFGRIGPGGHWARDAARAGNSIFLSGNIGGISAAVLALSTIKLGRDVQEISRRVLTRPQLPLALAEQLRNSGIPIAAIDLSDGLGIDAYRLADASNVGLEIYSTSVPLHPLVYEVAKLCDIDPLQMAFGFGGDGQFLFAVDSQHDAVALAAGGTKIGKILESREKKLVTPRGKYVLPNFGHEDFTGEKSIDRLIRFLNQPIESKQ